MSVFFMLLGLLFIGLKLTGHIAWSWWLVLLPIYAVPVIGLCILAVAGIMILRNR